MHRSRITKFKSLDKELEDLNMLAVQVPLKDDISLTILEPKDSGERNGLKVLATKLFGSPSRLAQVLENLDGYDPQVKLNSLKIPKFSFENDIDLVEPLKSMGIVKMFDTSTSELMDMIRTKPFGLSRVKHQAMIEVNEHGIKAAAVTKMSSKGFPLRGFEQIDIAITNPFLFLIRHKQMVLFAGQLVNLDQTRTIVEHI